MTTDDGTVISEVSLLDRVTVSGLVRSKLIRVTVPVAAAGPEYSQREFGVIVRLSASPSGTVRSSSWFSLRREAREGEERFRSIGLFPQRPNSCVVSGYVSVKSPVGPVSLRRISRVFSSGHDLRFRAEHHFRCRAERE